jgi:large subunit ribosomal protein L28
MAQCEVCNKTLKFGIQVSHSHRRSNRTWKPNIRKVKALINGTPTKISICSRCLRSGNIERA